MLISSRPIFKVYKFPFLLLYCLACFCCKDAVSSKIRVSITLGPLFHGNWRQYILVLSVCLFVCLIVSVGTPQMWLTSHIKCRQQILLKLKKSDIYIDWILAQRPARQTLKLAFQQQKHGIYITTQCHHSLGAWLWVFCLYYPPNLRRVTGVFWWQNGSTFCI